MSYLERFSEMLRQKKQRFEVVDGQLFIRQDRWVAPLGPVAHKYTLSERQCRDLLSKLGGFWVQWTDGFGPHASESEWYALVCRKYIPVEEMTSHSIRKQVRRGLNRCEVRQVDAREIAQHGYETYCAAIRGYGSRESLPTAEEFARRVMTDAPFSDVHHHWAVYHEGKLIAFNQNKTYDKIEVDYTLGKFHPDYLKQYPAYALFLTMNEYYLVQQQFQYVHAGARSISHETDIQEFLVRLFNFEKTPTRLHVHYRPPFGAVLRAARPFRVAAAALSPKASALFELDRLRVK